MLWPLFSAPPVTRCRKRVKPATEGDPSHELGDQAADEVIVARARQGDLSSFHELIQRHQGPVFNVVLRTVKDSGIAEDVTQDAFIRAWRSVEQFRGGNVRGWLMRIAVNRAYDVLRSQKRRPAFSLDELDYEPVPEWSTNSVRDEDPQAFSSRVELAEVLEQVLARVPDDQRTALLLVDLQGFSYEEAAGIMSVAPGTIKSRISRARARMREELRTQPHTSELFDRFLRQESDTPA